MSASSRRPDHAASSRPRWRRWAAWLAVPAVVVVLLLGAWLLVTMVRVPLPEDVAPGATTVLDRDGNVVGSLAGDQTRRDVALNDLPEHTRLAVLAAEDRQFYTHGGVSPLGILRALVANVRAGDVTQGGSTITQQYVKNAIVGNEQSMQRKVREAALAVKLDREYDKDTVLEWYLNTIYWGRGAHGIGAASETYFEIPASELSINQSATLAGIISAPEAMDPRDNPERANTRREYVLDGMLEQDWITQEQHDDLVAEGLPEVSNNTALATQTAPYYLDAVRRELTAELGRGAVQQELKVFTGLDLSAQRAAEQAVRDVLADHGLDADDLSAAVVSLDPQTGVARSVVGGPDISSQSFNAAVRARRQVGSTFKAFTLTGWLEDGKSPESRFDAPASIEVGDDHEIRDYAGRDRGTITLFEALQVSANTVFAQVQQELGPDPIVDVATRLGLPGEYPGEDGEPRDAFSRVPTMTLGVDGFTPFEMAEAFNTYAAEGLHTPAHTIVRVETADGEVLFEANEDGDAAISANDARTATEAMRRVITSGTGTGADIGRPAAGKTGTTQGGADGWFAGYTPDLTTVAWVGRLGSNEAVEGLSGANLPVDLWREVMLAALEGVEPSDFAPPDLSVYEVVNPAPEPCPDGYSEADEVEEPTDDGTDSPETRTEVAPGTEDREGGPCIRVVTVEPTETETTEEPTETESPTPTPTETTATPTETETTEEETTEEETTTDEETETATETTAG